jgi:omega-amidase
MQDLKVCLIQTSIIWENKQANFEHLENHFLSKIKPGQCDLILLPEMFNTGFSMNTEELG